MEDISVETLGTRLVELRKKYNFTQADIGEKLNVSVQAVSKWENDLSLPDYDYLIKLADLFNTSIDELLGRKKEIVRQEENKDKNKLLFKISIKSADGDEISINLPLLVIKVLVENNSNTNIISGNESLKNIDFASLLSLAEQGVIGEIVNIKSADGDIIKIVVE